MNTQPPDDCKGIGRKGTVLICVLTCSLIAITLGACAIRLAVRSTRSSKQTMRLRQTQWILEAGIQRSQLRVSNDNFDDELWRLPRHILPGGQATVHIKVEDADDNTVIITVTAEYGPEPGSERNIRRSYTYRHSRVMDHDLDGASVLSKLQVGVHGVAKVVKTFGGCTTKRSSTRVPLP